MDHPQGLPQPTPLSEFLSRMPNPLELQAKAGEEEKPVKRALTSYNIFFQAERARLLEERRRTGQKSLGFAGLARHIAAKWKRLDAVDRLPFEALAAQDKQRYQREKQEWKQKSKQQNKSEEKTEKPAVEQGSALATILGRPQPNQINDNVLPITSQSLLQAPHDASIASMLNSAVPSLPVLNVPPGSSITPSLLEPVPFQSQDPFALHNAQLRDNKKVPHNAISPSSFDTMTLQDLQQQDSKQPQLGLDIDEDDLDLTPLEICSYIDHRNPTHTVQQLSDSMGEDCVQYFVNCFQNDTQW